jgi:hypothetical protein
MRTFETMPFSSESSAEEVATELARIAPEAGIENCGGIVVAVGRRPEIHRCADGLRVPVFM